MSDDNLRQLHDKATRGEQLSPEEQARLEDWYAKNDQEESGELSASSDPEGATEIRCKLDEAMSELTAASQRVRELTADNDTIRREIGVLRHQLAQQSAPHPA